jgi:hypothetical protein
MSKKYKELPAFETNEFKVGDLINVYIGHYLYKVRVTRTHEYLVFFSGADTENGEGLAHFKQCRKLEEIKPREFFIDLRTYRSTDVIPSEYSPNPWGPDMRVIKVREVLEDE